MADGQSVTATRHTGVRRPLSVRLVLATFVVGVLIACVAIGVQLVYAYHRASVEAEATLDEIGTSMVPSFADGLWQVDGRRVDGLMNGVARLPGVTFVELQATEGEHYERGDRRAAELVSRDFTLTHAGPLERGLGTLHVVIGIRPVFANIVTLGLSTALVTVLSIAAVAFSFLWLFRRLVTRHLVAMSSHAQQMTST